MADYRCKILADDITGLQLRINQWDVNCRMSGAFNAYNLTAVLAVAHGLGQDQDEVLSILSGLKGAEGRMEKVEDTVRNRTGIVDYAHTPDALENVLKTIVASAGKDQKIIAVVGMWRRQRCNQAPGHGSFGSKICPHSNIHKR